MLIATLPTYVCEKDLDVAEKVLATPQIQAARYNSGGASPLPPLHILKKLKHLADSHSKKLYIDLEGRQVRVAHWTPMSRGVVQLNRKFELELPGSVFFRGAGWCEITNFDAEQSKIYFEPRHGRNEYFFGEGQSAHVVAKCFKVESYLSENDLRYIEAACQVGITNFMLSFVEEIADLGVFRQVFISHANSTSDLEVVLKIESPAGVNLIKSYPSIVTHWLCNLMAARDDLFLGYDGHHHLLVPALKTIINADPQAIVASRLLSGLERGSEISMSDISDAVLMSQLGYTNFMFSDELAFKIDQASEAWQSIISPNIDSMKGV